MQAGKWLEDKNMDINEVMNEQDNNTRTLYKRLRGDLSKVPRRRLTCNNSGSPKWVFALYLAIQERIWISITRSSAEWNEELKWAIEHASSKSAKAELYRVTL